MIRLVQTASQPVVLKLATWIFPLKAPGISTGDLSSASAGCHLPRKSSSAPGDGVWAMS